MVKYNEENEKKLSSWLENQTRNWMQWQHEYVDKKNSRFCNNRPLSFDAF